MIKLLFLLAFILAISYSLVQFFFHSPATSYLEIVFCDVGQGDATFMQMDSVQILVDGGIDESVLRCLRRYMPALDETIEVVIATHADADHIGGLPMVMEKYTTPLLITNGLQKESADFEAFNEQLKIQLRNGSQHVVAGEGLELGWGELRLRFVAPLDQTFPFSIEAETQLWDTLGDIYTQIDDHNVRSVALKVTFGYYQMVLTGDLYEAQELALVARNMITPLTLLKAGHHGSKTSSSLPFLEAAQPEIVSISAGKNNRYSHPSPEVIARIDQIGAQIVRTDLEGDVRLRTDGRSLWRVL